ncbi:hypothetical protein ACEQ8H_007553 [Pleosporales sp. CAS-2024a]
MRPGAKNRRSLFMRPVAYIKQHITIPATFGNRCSQPFEWYTIPPRVQSLTILLFVLMNLILCVCSYQLTDDNLYWPEKSTQLLRYVSDRTGILSLANFPLVWLFGMRNDALMWITGWGFGTYNAFHRWVARVATLQAVMHSLGYTLMIVKRGGWPDFCKYLTQHYFWNGELATVAMSALLLFSLYGIRRSYYEIFLVTHIVLSVVALWTMYYHVELFPAGEYNIFLWPCLAIWLIDRGLRAGRIFAFNRNFCDNQATVSYDSGSNLLRMEVDGSRNWLQPAPGTYYYIYVLDDMLYAHQSHPFTLAYTTTTPDMSIAAPLTPLSPMSNRPSPEDRTFLSDESSDESDAFLAASHTGSRARRRCHLVFLIRPYDGFTSRLKSHCLLHGKKLRVLLEGPYGHSHRIHRFPHVLFIVGGTGIAVALSHMARLLSPSSRAQAIRIVWAVRQHAFLASILRDLAGVLGDARVDMAVHVTRESEGESESESEGLGAQVKKSVRIVATRPHVSAVVEQAAEEAGPSRLAVIACGPASMADEARRASVEMLGRGYWGVEYFEESFKW